MMKIEYQQNEMKEQKKNFEEKIENQQNEIEDEINRLNERLAEQQKEIRYLLILILLVSILLKI